MLRREIVPSDDAELNDPAHLGPGESMLVVNLTDYTAGVDPRNAEYFIFKHTGLTPKNNRCAQIDSTGKVVAVIAADEEIDSVEGHMLINHPAVEVGHTYHKDKGFLDKDGRPVVAPQGASSGLTG